jgi:nucleoid-associated protein YgaU
VRPGDSLWGIAARHLPAGASAGRIDAAWRQWYAANRSVIGGDPNLILPGQHLIAPTTEGSPS